MKGLEISGENLEDLLAYDDLFLDYFNAFLALPVFPQALVYNRLTGAFEEVDDGGPLEQPATSYGATDAEREKMLEWARQERLPMFLKTQLFRELKLVKLLLRPLEERQSASRGSSRNLRGYSRQTETYVSSLSNSVDNSAHDGLLEDEDLWGELHYSALYRYQRPGSRALSVPIKNVHADDSSSYDGEDEDEYSDSFKTSSSKKTHRVVSTGAKSADKRASTEKRAARISSKVDVIPPANKSGKTRSSQRTKAPPASSTEEAFKKGARALSAPITYAHFLKMPPMDFADFDAMFGEVEPEHTGQAYVTFEDDHVSDEQTETDVRNMEGRFKMTLQQMKEHIFCSRAGFEQFHDFLRDTSSGCVLLDFWLDCEDFKDTMEDFDDHKQREMATMLFRDIQDKYKLKLSQDAKEQITRSASNMTLSHTIFLRTQYDVLRRLRAYWLPRYLTHCERTDTLDLETKIPEPPTAARVLKPLRPSRPQAALFPTISLVHSMPALPEEARNFSFTKTRASDGGTSSLGRSNTSLAVQVRGHHRKGKERPMWRRRTISSASISTLSRQSLMSGHSKDRFLLSLAQDRVAGGPFRRYLSKRLGDEQLLSCLLFWQDVTEYGATEDRSADRLLRMCHAWNIYIKFLSEDSPHKVEISEQDRLNLHKTLQSARDFIEASVFDRAKTLAVSKLEKAWVRFLKEDLKAFLDCRVRVGGESPPSTAEAIEITVTDQDVLINRPRPWVRRLQPLRIPGSAASERARRLQKALLMAEDIDDERRAQKRKEAQERRKAMERERRKAVRAAYARQREAKKKKPSISSDKGKVGEGEEGDGETLDGSREVEEDKEEKKGVSYQDLSTNRQVMSIFRKYLAEQQEGPGKEVPTLMHLYQEIESYWATKDAKQKKELVATHIYKTYLDPQSKKHTPTNERLAQRIQAEKDRPKSATLREIQRFILPKVEDTFKEFINYQAGEMGVNPQDLANMSQAELTIRMGSDQSLYSGWQKSGFKGVSRGKADSQATESGPLLSGEGATPSSRQADSSNPTPHRRVRRGGKATGRSQPSRDDKNEFLHALGQSAAGQPTIPMLYFYKYLLKHGEEDGMPQLDKDLFFYIEVQKFKDCSHAFSDEEMLKRKVQSIVDCFLDSVYSPTLQVDISSEMHTKTMKTAQRYLGGKDVVPSLFDDAQFYIFKELLPYWSGFRKSQGIPDQPKKRPVTKYQKMLKKRLETIENYQIPSADFQLPRIPEGAVPSYTITLSDGVKYREEQEMSDSPTPLPDTRERRGSRMTVDNASRKGHKTSVTKEPVVTR